MNRSIKIKTNNLTLGPIREQNAQAIFKYRSDPSVYQFQRWQPQDIDDVHRFIKKFSPIAILIGKWNQLGIFLSTENKLLGDCGFCLTEERQVKIGYTIDPQYQQKGYATEAVTGLIEYLFSHLNIHRVTAHTDPMNLASQKVVQKLGFRQEGHFRKSLRIGDKWFDDLVFALLKEEWEKT